MTNEGLDLKPCPFCGNTGESMRDFFLGIEKDEYERYMIACFCCDTRGPYEDTKEDAISKWNERYV